VLEYGLLLLLLNAFIVKCHQEFEDEEAASPDAN
jgi:hypothetical protein